MRDPRPESPSAGDPEERASFRDRARRFWNRHRRLFWMVHSVWALVTGIAVVVLAHERYSFVPWVVVFLGVTWLSTLFFGGRPDGTARGVGDRMEDLQAPPVGVEITSYLTRTLYQETLFFLIPFFAYSTVPTSPNLAFTALLVGLALLSCLDLLFDRLLRTSPLFGMLFFATVAFAALTLLLPIVLQVDPAVASRVAAVAAVATAAPLVWRGARGLWGRTRMLAPGLAILVVGFALPVLVPPVPLRMTDATFAAGIDPDSLELSAPLESPAPAASVEAGLVVLVEVFSPSELSTTVELDWFRDGERIGGTGEVQIAAHPWGFRVWGLWRPETGATPPGRYRTTLKTREGRVFGVAELEVR
ncbi:MAG: DUF5924 family protein [Thermoanaerobaculia bacterium]|nr:DUF5924 family protein [Thermoanaerobaculia bacterium]